MSIGEAVAAVVVAVASALNAPSAGIASSGWVWPLRPEPSVMRGFDPPDQPWLAGHRGVDLSTSVGAPVLAPSAGHVSFSGRIAGRGVVVVSHPGGLRSTFEPVESRPPVGTTVSKSGHVGIVESAAGHCAPAACLHWGVLRGDTYLDPLSLVGRATIILLTLS